jgi:glycerol-3-phosphate dehydrogenase
LASEDATLADQLREMLETSYGGTVYKVDAFGIGLAAALKQSF